VKEDYNSALERIIDTLENERKYEEALTFAGKLLELDPCSELACQRVLQLHALNDDRTAVIRTYQAFEKNMRQELEIEPGPKTKELYRRLSESFRLESAQDTTTPVFTGGNGADKDWPMIGRTREWKLLLEAWDKARIGTMQWVMLRGETGIGKSRLGRELLIYLSKQGFTGARARCYEAPGTPGYGPVADWLRSPSFSSRIGKLDEIWLDELSRLLPEFSERLQNTPDSEPWQQRRFEEALARALLADSEPCLLLLEEMQWCDPETLGWLDFILNREQPAPLLVVSTLRTTAGNPYANEAMEGLLNELRLKHRLHVIEPSPLDRSQTQELSSKILKREINETMAGILYRETEGNPLFILEMARELHLLERLKDSEEEKFIAPDQTPSQIRKLPRVVSEVISGRFRYLSPKSREVLGIAAAAGREFSFNLIAGSSDLSPGELVDALEELIHHHIFREVKAEFYDFTHDKLREVAYKELSSTRCRRLHICIADALQKIHKDNLAPWHTRLAFHYERAGETEAALDQYQRAALHARDVTSLQDVGMLDRALELLNTLPESPERDRHEFELITSLAMSYLQRRQFDSEEVFRLCERVYLLSSELGEPPPIVILFTFGIAKLMSGDSAVAIELGLVMHTLAKQTNDSAAETEACYLLGFSNRVAGNLADSAKWYEEGLSQDEKGVPLTHMQIYDLDGSILLRMEAAISMLLTGREDDARKLMESTKATVRSSDWGYGDAYIYYATTWFEALLRNSKAVRKMAEQFLEFEIAAKLMHWSTQLNILLGWAIAAQGYPERGTEQIQDGINQLEELEYNLDLPYYYLLFAESLIAAEAYPEAEKALKQAKEIIDRTSARFAESEIYRVEGELLLAQDPSNSNAACEAFKKAIEIAHGQGSLLFENRSSDALQQISKPAIPLNTSRG
jgi:predicted ATPase